MKKKFLLFIFLFLAFSFSTAKVFAGIDGTDEVESAAGNIGNVKSVEIPLSDKIILRDGTPVKNVFNSTDDMVNLIVKVIFVSAGLFLLFMIIGAGFSLVQGDSKDKDKAKTTMTSAVIGFVIMFAAYWIMQIIQILTGMNMGF